MHASGPIRHAISKQHTATVLIIVHHGFSHAFRHASMASLAPQVLCPHGSPVPPGVVEDAATKAGLQLRSGCNCNPGICLPNLGLTPEDERARAAAKHTGQLLTVTRGGVPVQLPTGSVRVSLGYLSTFEDVHAFAAFLAASFVDDKGMQLAAAYAEVDPEFNADQYC